MVSKIFHGTFIAFAISHVKGFNLPASRIPNSCPTQSGSSCVFPFSYKGVTHYQCTYADSPVPWCATQVSSDGSVVTNMWGDCDMSSTSSCSAESLSISSCTATSGQQCVFPFRYKGVVYTECTSIDQSQPWCSTSVTSSGNHQTRVGDSIIIIQIRKVVQSPNKGMFQLWFDFCFIDRRPRYWLTWILSQHMRRSWQQLWRKHGKLYTRNNLHRNM